MNNNSTLNQTSKFHQLMVLALKTLLVFAPLTWNYQYLLSKDNLIFQSIFVIFLGITLSAFFTLIFGLIIHIVNKFPHTLKVTISVFGWLTWITLMIVAFLPIFIPVSCINGHMMEPVFKDGELVKIKPRYYHHHIPKRNDLVIYKSPINGNKKIGWIIGLPNEQISVRFQSIMINNQEFGTLDATSQQLNQALNWSLWYEKPLNLDIRLKDNQYAITTTKIANISNPNRTGSFDIVNGNDIQDKVVSKLPQTSPWYKIINLLSFN